MKIAIVILTGGGLSGGFRKYLQNVLPLIVNSSFVIQLNVFIPPSAEKLLSLDSIPILSWPLGDSRKGYRWLKSRVRELSPDVIFIPNARWINFNLTPVVIMVHNMEPLTVPFCENPLQEKIKNIFRAYLAKKACRKADRVIAVSGSVKDFLINQWKIKSDKIGVVYHGVDPTVLSDTFLAPLPLREKTYKQFIFTAGSIRPARGLEDAINATSVLKRNGIECKLVIAGVVDPGMEVYKSRLEKLALKLNVESQIIWIGMLSMQEMFWCYDNCTAFVMTSRAEACSNVALEAISHGCICVASINPCLPEIFGDAAIFYPPKDGKALAEAIQTVLNWDIGKRNIMSEKARKRATEFSWDVCAEKTLEELKKAIGSSKERGSSEN
jgi:glycosyltransferase involved in cell wall biosynthesis